MKKVKSTSIINLLKESVENKTRKVKVTFYPAYEPALHKNLSEKLKANLKKPKVSYFDVIDETLDILKLQKSKDVKSIVWSK